LPVVTRKRIVTGSPTEVHELVSNPARLPEWWPRVIRVEDISGGPGAAGTRWTCVLEADSGRLLRLDYRCSSASPAKSYEWEHELEGTPYEAHLTRQSTEIRLAGTAEGTEVRLTTVNSLRGSARIAGFSMKKGQRQLLDSALVSLAGIFGEPDSK